MQKATLDILSLTALYSYIGYKLHGLLKLGKNQNFINYYRLNISSK